MSYNGDLPKFINFSETQINKIVAEGKVEYINNLPPSPDKSFTYLCFQIADIIWIMNNSDCYKHMKKIDSYIKQTASWQVKRYILTPHDFFPIYEFSNAEDAAVIKLKFI